MVAKVLDVDVLVLGAGPGGLAAAMRLAQAGRKPLVIERSSYPGGLMRSICHGEFTVDLGRKELTGRVPEVFELWGDVLGDDFASFPRRLGVLFHGRIYEAHRRHRGLLHGMNVGEFVAGVASLAVGKLPRTRATDYQHQIYHRIGKRFATMFYQGYEQKIGGLRWNERPPEETVATKAATRSIRSVFKRAFSDRSVSQPWRHPALGTGQIVTALHQKASEAGAKFWFDASLQSLDTAGGRVVNARVERDDEVRLIRPQAVISSLPVERLSAMLDLSERDSTKVNLPRRSTICVYLFADEPPRFPHSWLKVTCPRLRAARITNYAKFGSRMVPDGKACLCVEFCCLGEDQLLDQSGEQLRQLAIDEVAGADLVDPHRVFDALVFRLPGVDGATDLNDWWNDDRRAMYAKLQSFINLYSICQPGTEFASLAGLEAAKAIVGGRRDSFDQRMDPSELFQTNRC